MWEIDLRDKSKPTQYFATMPAMERGFLVEVMASRSWPALYVLERVAEALCTIDNPTANN